MRSDSFSPALLAQFDVEQRALASASHDSIARFIGSGATTDGRPWIAMEWVEGQPITAYCDARRLDVDARLALLGEVCDAVQHLHERGIIHGDLKPSNILVTERDGRARPKLIDLGLARLRADAPDLDTPVMGTPAYMAPEQFDLAEPLRDERSDVFALGRVLRELLVGEPRATSTARAGLGPILLASRAPELPLRAHFDRLGAATDSVARRRGTRARALVDTSIERWTASRSERPRRGASGAFPAHASWPWRCASTSAIAPVARTSPATYCWSAPSRRWPSPAASCSRALEAARASRGAGGKRRAGVIEAPHGRRRRQEEEVQARGARAA